MKVTAIIKIVPSAGNPYDVIYDGEPLANDLLLADAKEAAERVAVTLKERTGIPIVNVRVEPKPKKRGRWR